MQNETEFYNYFLPENSINQEPYSDPGKSKLLIASDKTIVPFSKIENFIPPNSLLIFNKSKVQKVRIIDEKSTGGNIEFFVLEILSKYTAKCLIKSTDKKTTGKKYFFSSFNVEIINVYPEFFEVKFSENILNLIENIGKVPLPPYIKDESRKYKYYNNQFSNNGFSVASPTAGLHFTNTTIEKLKKSGHEIVFINLDVNLGTFKPITTKYIEDHKIHSEKYNISEKDFIKILNYKKLNKNILCIGTTSLRAIESAFINNQLEGETDLFILPNTKLNLANQLITNFHAPKSSLLSIVHNIYGNKWRELYEFALNKKMKFLSFGDAVLFDINE